MDAAEAWITHHDRPALAEKAHGLDKEHVAWGENVAPDASTAVGPACVVAVMGAQQLLRVGQAHVYNERPCTCAHKYSANPYEPACGAHHRIWPGMR